MRREGRPGDGPHVLRRGLQLKHAVSVVAAAIVFLLNVDAHAANACVQANGAAQDLKNAGRLREARAQLLVCAQKSCNAVIRSDCEKWLKEVDEQTPTVIVRLVDSRGHDVLGAKVTIDDARIELDGKPVTVDPGPRAIRATTKSGESAETKVLVAQGEKARVIELKFKTELAQDGTRPTGVTTPEPVEKPPTDKGPAERKDTAAPPPPVLPLALGAVGVVGLGAFAFFQITGRSDFSDLENGCARTAAGCTDAEIDPVKTKFVISTIGLGIGVVALGAAAIVYFTQKPSNTALRFSPVIRF